MKKSQLKKLIRESIKQLKKEQVIQQGGSAGFGTCNEADFKTGCAIQADLTNQFVNNSPQTFLNNMWDRYTNAGNNEKGCTFLAKRYDIHQSHMQSGFAGPQGNKPMGPKWKNQKQSKIDWFECIIQKCQCNNPPLQEGLPNLYDTNH